MLFILLSYLRMEQKTNLGQQGMQGQNAMNAQAKGGMSYKKLGDLFDEIDEQLQKTNPNYDALTAHKKGDIDPRLRPLLERLHQLRLEIEKLNASNTELDTHTIGHLQVRLNAIDTKAREDYIFAGDLKKRDIPRGQASLRDLLEKCHDMISQLLEKLPENEKMEYKEKMKMGGTGMQQGTEMNMQQKMQMQQGMKGQEQLGLNMQGEKMQGMQQGLLGKEQLGQTNMQGGRMEQRNQTEPLGGNKAQ